jgi:hypothetical protein
MSLDNLVGKIVYFLPHNDCNLLDVDLRKISSYTKICYNGEEIIRQKINSEGFVCVSEASYCLVEAPQDCRIALTKEDSDEMFEELEEYGLKSKAARTNIKRLKDEIKPNIIKPYGVNSFNYLEELNIESCNYFESRSEKVLEYLLFRFNELNEFKEDYTDIFVCGGTTHILDLLTDENIKKYFKNVEIRIIDIN